MTGLNYYARFRAIVPVLVLAAAGVVLPVWAQEWRVVEDTDWCDDNGRYYCEVREITLSDDRDQLAIRSTNGNITVESWDRKEIHILARIRVKGSEDRAMDTADQISISTRGTIMARGPRRGWWIFGGNRDWSVSYRVRMPERFDVDAHTTNGSLSISDVIGAIDAGTTNGTVTLTRIGGDVDCGTTNGGITVVLEGGTWNGDGLDLHATNGGISVAMPRGYSARLDASTTNGGISVEHAIRLEKKSRGRLRGTIGDGGPVIRVRTTNGGVRFVETH